VYAYTGARLASGTIKYEEVGPALPAQVISLPYQKPVFANGVIKGNIPILDIQYGNVWTNIDKATFAQLGVKPGDMLTVTIYQNSVQKYTGAIPFQTTFSAVAKSAPLAYLNSLLNLSFALNEGSFSAANQVFSGPEWSVEVRK